MEKTYPQTKICVICKRELDTKKDFYVRDIDSSCPRSECKACFIINKRMRKYNKFCSECHLPCRPKRNGKCYKCNKRQGLRECSRCFQLLSYYLSFYKDRGSVCKKCYLKGLRKTRKKDAFEQFYEILSKFM